MTDIEINKPRFRQGTGTHYIWWDDLGLTIELSRFKDDSHCEIMVRHNNGSSEQIVLQPTNCNLTSTRELSSLAGRLSGKTPDLDKEAWGTMLDYVSYESIKASREGEPVVLLDESYGKQPPEFIIDPLIVKNLPNLLYAEKGSAKSQFVSALALSLESKTARENALKLNISLSDHICLYLDWEQDQQTVGWVQACLRRGLRLPGTYIHYRHCSTSLADDLAQIQNKIEQTHANILIIDSLGLAVGGDLNLTEPALRFYAALRQLPATPIIIAQTSKDVTNKRKTVYGNALYEYLARSIWEIGKEQEKGSSTATLTLYHRKPAPFRGYADPMAFKFTFNYDNTVIERTEANPDKREDSGNLSTSDSVLAILDTENKRLTPKEIADMTDPKIPIDNVRHTLKRLKDSGKVIRYEEDGTYELK